MDFVVDKVSEDSFFINLLTGLPQQLDKFQKLGITTRHLTRKLPVSHSEICMWEQKQSILLPEDLRNFYNSCNGFLFTWSFKFGSTDASKEITGKLHVNELENLTQIIGPEARTTECSGSGVNTTNVERFELRLGVSSRLFELLSLDDANKVLLVYLNSRYSPTIWITTGPQEFYFLADDFTTYFRMSLAHIGIPNWQLLFTPQGVPQWTENMIRLLAPNLLQTNRTVESARKQREKEILEDHVEIPVNCLDVAIFKCLPRLPHNLPRVVEKEKERHSPSKCRRDKNDRERLTREKSFSMIKSSNRRK